VGVVRLELVGAEGGARAVGEEELPGKVNYFIGRDPRKWRRGLPTYGRVRYRGIYRGVDVVYYGREGELEYDLEVGAGVDPGAMEMVVGGEGEGA